MASRLAEARTAARSARRRLAAIEAVEGGVIGAVFGAGFGVLLALVTVIFFEPVDGLSTRWSLVLPGVGFGVGAAWFMARSPSLSSAALALDLAAGTDEAFVSALTAADAPAAFRELAAGNALRRCPVTAVARVLPFVWPRRLRAAVVAVALLAALVLVAGPDRSGASASTPLSFLPSQRVLVPAAVGGPREIRQEDLGQASAERLRQIAEVLLASDGYAEAERALAALSTGDTATALRELEQALARAAARVPDGRPGRSAAAEDGAADGPSSSERQSDGTRAPWATGSWPLRYDRIVDRWVALEDGPAHHEEAR